MSYTNWYEAAEADQLEELGVDAADAFLKAMATGRQVGGNHYQKAIQPWDAMEAWMSEEAFKGYIWGNVIKYISRWEDKGGRQDLEKAMHYLEKLLEIA